MPYRLFLVIGAGFLSASSFWMFLPLLSLSLRAEGASDALVGIMSGLPWAGLLAVSVFIPRILHRIGLQRMVLLGMALSAVVFLGFAGTRAISLWAGLTLLLGVALGLRWAGVDTWISGSVPNHLRGRLIGAFELIMAGAMAVGPAMLAVLGSSGAKPFLAAAAVACAAMALLAAAGREASGITEPPGTTRALDVLRAELASYSGIALVGITEACNLSLLPVMGLGLGATLHRAALLLVICQIGAAAGSLACGVLADRLNRRSLKRGAALVMAALPLAVPFCLHGRAIWPVLALWGAAQGGLFTVGVVKLGTRFSGTALARAMSLAMVVYTCGGIAGPPLMGGIMATFGPAGLVYGQAALALVGVALIALRRTD